MRRLFPLVSMGAPDLAHDSRRNAACSTEKELHGVALSVHGSIRAHHLAPNLAKRFINAPDPTHLSLESVPALLAGFGMLHCRLGRLS